MFQAYEEYKKMELSTKSDNTIRAYTRAIESFLEYFSIETIEDFDALGTREFKEYQMYLLDEGMSANSVNLNLTILKAFVRFMEMMEITENVKIRLVKNLKKTKHAVFTLTREQVIAMLNATKTDDERLMLLLMLTAGLRRSEVARIKLEDIEGCNLHVYGKGDKEDIIPMTDEVCELMGEYLETRKHESEYLFIGKGTHDGITGDAIWARIRRIAFDALPEEVAEKVTPHTMRKVFVTNIVRETGSLLAGQVAARHANPQTTQQCYVNMNDVLDNSIITKQRYL